MIIIIIFTGGGIGVFWILLALTVHSVKKYPKYVLFGAILYGILGWFVGNYAREYSLSQSATAQAFINAGMNANAFAPQTMAHFIASGVISGAVGFALGKFVLDDLLSTSSKLAAVIVCNLCAGIPFALLSLWWLISMHGF